MATLKVAVPAGIGDTLWVLTKMEALLSLEGAEKVDITVCSDPLRRAEDFLKRFSFVNSVSYCDLGILENPIATKEGYYNYAPSQRNWHNRFDWFLQANGHLEAGNRLEDWFPELRTNWYIFDQYQWNAEDYGWVAEKVANQNYVVFYCGPESGNTREGHNRGALWTPEDWKNLALKFISQGLKIAIVGAEYDRSYLRHLSGFEYTDYVGKLPISHTLFTLCHAKCVIGYQSGVTISAAFLGTPGAGFWRPQGDSVSTSHFISFSEKMASAWVPPHMLENKLWLPCIYTKCSPESIFEYAKENWLCEK